MEARPDVASRSRGILRNLSLDLFAAIGVGTTTALVVSLLPTIARRGGLEPLGLAALGAAPFLANLLAVFAGRVGPRSPAQLALLRGLGAGLLLLLFVAPAAPMLIAVAAGLWLSLSFGAPFQLRLWGAMYPARLRGRVVGLLGTGRAAASAVAALAGGVLADRYGGIAVVAMAGLIGSACAMAYAGLRARATEIPAPFSARESLRALRQRPVLRQLVLAQGFYGGGLIAAVPLYALVNVDRLRLSLGEVGTIGILGALATTLSFFAWGAIADRHGAVAAMRLGSLLGLCSLVAYALAPSVVALWFAALALGAANPSIEVGVAAAVSAETPLSERSSALAGWNAITGVRGILAPFLMSGMVQAGLLDVTSGLLVCAAVSAVGTVLFLRVGAEPIRRPGLSAVKRSRLARGLRSLRVASADR